MWPGLQILVDLDDIDAPVVIDEGTRHGAITGVTTYAFGNYRIHAPALDPAD